MTALFAWLERRGTLLAGLWFAVIAVATLSPAAHLPLVPGGDKLHHLAGYGVLLFLACVPKRRAAVLLTLLLGAIAFGGAVELIQPYIRRSGEWADFAANAAGACFGCIGALTARALTSGERHAQSARNNTQVK